MKTAATPEFFAVLQALGYTPDELQRMTLAEKVRAALDGSTGATSKGKTMKAKNAGKMRQLLQSAVDRWPEIGSEEPINGAEVVDWLADFLRDAQRALRDAETCSTKKENE